MEEPRPCRSGRAGVSRRRQLLEGRDRPNALFRQAAVESRLTRWPDERFIHRRQIRFRVARDLAHGEGKLIVVVQRISHEPTRYTAYSPSS